MSYYIKKADSDYGKQIEEAIQKAKEELADKTLKQVQISTAITWCGRACVAAKNKSEDAVDYAHESIEHAALSGDDALLKMIRDILKDHGIEL
jgi:DUF1009 family protein